MMTKHNSYPISRMDECVDAFAETTLFSTLDTSYRYGQTKNDENV